MPSREVRIAADLISIALAWLTYRLIEKPIPFEKHSRAKTIILLVLMVVVGYAGYNSYKRDGLPLRAFTNKNQEYTKSMMRHGRQKECFDLPFAYEKNGDWFCKHGENTRQPSIFAYGDSHAFSLAPAIEKFGIENKVSYSLQSVVAPRSWEYCHQTGSRLGNITAKNWITGYSNTSEAII